MALFGCVEHLTQVPKINCSVSAENEDDVLELLKQVMPSWPTENVRMKKMEGGILNTMYVAQLEPDNKEKLVVRIYVDVKQKFDEKVAEALDRTRELKNLEKIRCADIGPELVAVFNNGLCYKFLEGEILDANSVRSEEIIPYIIKLLAKLHAQSIPEWTSAWDTSDFSFMTSTFPPDLKNAERTKRLLEIIPNKKALEKELQFIGQIGSTLESPRIFCHGDTKGENFIWNKEKKTLHLIDFEHSGSNLQSFEIGSHFISYTDIRDPKPDCFPDRDFQLKWIRMYLREFYVATGKDPDNVTEDDVGKLYIDTNVSSLIGKFLVGIGCLTLVANDIFDSYEFCMLHLKEYFERKDVVSALISAK